MNVVPRHLKSNSGSVLATTLVITFVLGATLVSFLLLAQHQVFANARSQSWNHSLAVAEAGVEDALQMINIFNADSTNLLKWANYPNYANSGWRISTNDPNVYSTVRSIGGDNRARYYVTIGNHNPIAPTITVQSILQYDFEHKHTPVGTATVGSRSDGFQTTYLQRKVYVTTRKDSLWTLAMLADRQIDLNGNNIATDSFNSADKAASLWTSNGFGIYDISKRRDHGDVATNWKLINSLNVGNANIMGTVSTGPGGTVAIGPNGSVGDEAWVSTTTGIQTGYVRDDMNVKLIDMEVPGGLNWFSLPTIPGGTNINGVNYKHLLVTPGDWNYKASTLKGSVYVGPNVNATVYLGDNVSFTGNEQIRIDSKAQRLTVYMAGSQFKLGGGGVVNETGRAENFLYFGLPSNIELKFGGNADFTGAIYAPQADFTLGGGGNTAYDFIGASVTRSVTMNGSFEFHYDEDLANFGPSRGFVPTSWAELKL